MDNLIALDSDWARDGHGNQFQSMGHEKRDVRVSGKFILCSEERVTDSLAPARREDGRM